MPVPGIPVSASSPRVDCWIARQEANTAIALGPLQQRPIRIFVVDATRDLHPSLATMLSRELHLDLQVSAWCEHWNRRVCFVVPLLPHIKTSVGGRRTAAACCGPRARLRIVHKLLRKPRWSIVPHPDSHLILAHRRRHPAVAGNSRGEECTGNHSMLHPENPDCKMEEERQRLTNV